MKNDMQTQEKDSGGFGAGIVLGALTGAVGMFLFGTKKGEKTLHKLKQKWESIKPKIEAELEQEGHVLEKSKKPFSQAVGEIVDYVADSLESGEKKSKPFVIGGTRQQSQQVKKRYFKKA